MLGVGGAGGFGFFFLLVPRLEAVPTKLRWDFFFLVFRDSELLVPTEEEAQEMRMEWRDSAHCPKPPRSIGIAYLDPILDFH